MYWNWVAIIRRESVIYLDSGSVCAKGELFEKRSILCRCRNAGPQEDDDWAIKSWPGRLTDPAKVSVGHTLLVLRCNVFTYRNSTGLPMPTLTLTRLSSSIFLTLGVPFEW